MTQDHGETQRPDGSPYRSYLLRLWQESARGGDRAVLQDVLSGESRGFSSLESLFAYLEASRAQAEVQEDSGPD